ncbi:questin oxidase family protein [Aeromicrobium wangtongii]|uniref:Questin oxidase family protein n=1 Tax=Aeromicrobium wangtongii TaxID=2969247 RepID=A0ABY5MAS2_9ACTN|nr:questin oxidase family protein [Aeromicrobium wangtongii]MCD9197423.1 questin oxidase family protein [Aeromicrobium wangtongii]UUP14917.1 questin oxidase family protein [Aeromicrobium wangtongii]
MTFEVLDEAYTRLRSTGPEFDDWLSNHGPMAAEALARHRHEDEIPGWLDGYSKRLEAAPRPSVMIDDWRAALGDARRLGDWLGWFDNELRDQPWTQVLQTWWPRLLPGIAAGATHGVIRVGHAVRVLREEGDTAARVSELGHGLGYWAARWQPVPAAASPGGHLDAASAVASIPAIPHQVGGIQSRFAQLDRTDGWPQAQRALASSPDWEALLRDVVNAAVRRYVTHAHREPVMLVHAATAPNAVLRTLPSLTDELWAPSAAAAWSASAAIHAAYASTASAPPARPAATAADAFDRAAQHGDEHVIKLADTALDTYAWTGDPQALAAVETAANLVDPP